MKFSSKVARLTTYMDKNSKTNENILKFLKNVPIYPKRIMPHSLGMKNCNLPTDSLLVEDDDGYVFFMSEQDKQKTIDIYSCIEPI